jgi:hypothetical protein
MVLFRFIRFLATAMLAYCSWLLFRVLVRRLFMSDRRPQERVHGKQRKIVKSSVVEDPENGGGG